MNYQLHEISRKSLKKGKNGILKIIFGRTGILLICLLLQCLLLFVGLQILAQYVHWFFGGYLIFGFLIFTLIINRTDNPGFQLSWTALVLLLPVFGGLLYLYVEVQPGTKYMKACLKEIDEKTKGSTPQDKKVLEELAAKEGRVAQLAGYIRKVADYPVYKNTKVTYFPSGEEKFAALVQELSRAKKYIFLEYFIIAEGYMWDTVFKILKAKVEEGVEVRVMYDGMNELSNLPHDFPNLLRGSGIQCKVFSPIYPVISTHYNNRDHRKVVVVDGVTAFTGGVNLADEYINRKERFGHWKDAGIMLQGDAAASFTAMFLKMWGTSGTLDNLSVYLREGEKRKGDFSKAEGFIMPYATSPFGSERIAERVYIEILNGAKQYVHIMTPYLVPGYELLQALLYASRRGVDVKLLLPHIPDKKYAFALAHTYYAQLIEAGIRIYEYTPGFVHSKVFVSDDRIAVVGAINLDYRSLYLNYECAVMLYEVEEIQKIEDDFVMTLPKCRLITPFEIRHDRFLRVAAGKLLRIVAPLM